MVSKKILVLAALIGIWGGAAHALPFNDDMVDVQLRAGSVMRPKAAESVPMGSLSSRVDPTEAEDLQNPLKGDARSANNGKRIFQVNCVPCHGDIEATPWERGLAAQKFIVPGKPPDLNEDRLKAKSDGYFYNVIHNGFGLMMPVGFKLSPAEHWDVVNYIRKVQASK